ncbi:Protein CBG10725 [Caenorhabditis briggsae]|uniref:Protein CBG10725 n=2 Tax=Caenorhabditis briggsae TaxID=6238 RepID=A8XBM9_CAEBR|nr:Protein CBG10725 [Caenorhabditis briggsae]CAP30045.2 Protein CBG10725 [Caenorhabditis briggsae]
MSPVEASQLNDIVFPEGGTQNADELFLTGLEIRNSTHHCRPDSTLIHRITMDSPAVQRKKMPSQEEPDTLTSHMFDQLQGGAGDPVSRATLNHLVRIQILLSFPFSFSTFQADEMKNQGMWPSFNVPYTGPDGNDNPYENPPDDEPPIVTADDGREAGSPSDHEDVDLHDNYDIDPNLEYVIYTSENLLDPDVMDQGGEEQEMMSMINDEFQTSSGMLPYDAVNMLPENEPAPINNDETTVEPMEFENDPPETFFPNNETTMEHEVLITENGYHLSSSTSSSSNVCHGIVVTSFPGVIETEDGEQGSSAPAQPPRTRDFNSQQDPTVADLSQQVENSLHVPDDLELDSYDKIFSGPLPIPKYRTVGPSSSDHCCDFQHQSWSSTAEAIPSITDSGYQSALQHHRHPMCLSQKLWRRNMGSRRPANDRYWPKSANHSEIFDSQQPKQYCELDKKASGSLHQVTTKYDFSGSGISEPWSSYYGIGFPHQPPPSLTDAIPSDSAKRKRSSPNSSDQFHHPAKKCKLDGRQLPCSDQQACFSSPVNVCISDSMQKPVIQDLRHENSDLNATVARKTGRISKKQQTVCSPPVQQSYAQEHPLDFLSLKSFQKYDEKKEKYLKCMGKGDTTEAKRVRQRTNVEDEGVRKEMDRNCDYSKKCAKKKKDAINDVILEFIEKVQEMEEVISIERVAISSLELYNFLGGRVDNSDCKAYETKKLLSTGFGSQAEQKVQETWKLFGQAKTKFQLKAQEYTAASKNAEGLSKEEKKKTTASPGSARSRAKSEMEFAEINYDIVCLGLIISKKAQLLIVAHEFARRSVNKIAPRASSNTEEIMKWVDRNGKTKEWDELKSFVEANPELRRSNLYN